MKRYDINGNEIYIAECVNCHHQVSILSEDLFDKGIVMKKLSEFRENKKCCNKSLYQWILD